MSRRTSRRALLASLVFVLALAPAISAHAYPRPGRTNLVSGLPQGGTPAGISTGGTISADGRYVAFTSSARALDPTKGNGATEVYVKDLLEGSVRRATIAFDGGDANQSSFNGGISSDGRLVVFTSAASNLVEGDTNGYTDTFIRDLVSGSTRRVSVSAGGEQANMASQNSAISPNGRFVAFASRASNLTEESTNGQLQILVKDLEDGSVHLGSRSTEGAEGNGSSFYPDISDNGTVTFYTFATNLIADDTNARNDVYVHDRASRVTERASVAWDGAQANDSSNRPVISADGRYVAFASYATNLVPNGTTPQIFPGEVYVRDLAEGTTERVSTGSAGNVGDGSSQVPEISSDGRYVGFTSFASDLVEGDANGMADAYLFDRELLRTERVSLGPGEVEGDERSSIASISPGGRYVGFFGQATNFTTGDENGEPDVFVRERGLPVDVVDVELSEQTDTGAGLSGGATFSGALVSEAEGEPLTERSVSITSAQVIYHHEEDQLLFRSKIQGLQTLPTPRSPLLTQAFGFTFSTEASDYEIRVYEDPAVDEPSGPYLVPRVSTTRAELYRCGGSCSKVGDLASSIGTTGSEVRAVVPLDLLGAEEVVGEQLMDLSASIRSGVGRLGATMPVHEVALPPATIPLPQISVGGGVEASPEKTSFRSVPLIQGRWTTKAELAPSDEGLWLRACLGEDCTLRWLGLRSGGTEAEPIATDLGLTITSLASNVEALALLTDGSTGISGKDLTFLVDGTPIGTLVSDDDGTAKLTLRRSALRPGSVVTVRFAGDGEYLPSEASATYSPRG